MPRRGPAGRRGRQRSRRRTAPVTSGTASNWPREKTATPGAAVARSAGTPQSVRAWPLPVTTTTGGPCASSAASAASARAASLRRCASTNPGRISSGSALQWASCCSASRAACSTGSSGRVRPKRSASPANTAAAPCAERRARLVAGHLGAIDRGARGPGNQWVIHREIGPSGLGPVQGRFQRSRIFRQLDRHETCLGAR
jgi:hypothetical protein